MAKKIKLSFTSKGIGIGKACFINHIQYLSERVTIDSKSIVTEIDKYQDIKLASIKDIENIYKKISKDNLEEAMIFKAHIEMINDPMIDEMIKKMIIEQEISLASAIEESYSFFITMLRSSDSNQNKDRIADLIDVKNRLINKALNIKEDFLTEINEDVIIIADELLPSDIIALDKEYIKGIITKEGSNLSHIAILVKNYEIPAIVGAEFDYSLIDQNDLVVLDGINEEIIVNPIKEELSDYINRKEVIEEENKELKKYLKEKCITKDKKRIKIMVNLNTADDSELKIAPYVDGVGLFRTEYLFYAKNNPPTLNEQLNVYKKILKKFGKKEVIIRTIDIGADKLVPYLDFKNESNPSLGNRGIRLCFNQENMFKTQIKALLMASLHGNMSIMVPMISSIDEIKKVKKIINECKIELDKENIRYGEYRFGIMIETPSIAILADKASEEVDFASIGTNDLTQYLLAVDRFDNSLKEYFQKYNPAVLRIIGHTIKEFKKNKKDISICGELAGDKDIIKVLIGLGVKKISMSINSVPIIKKEIINTNAKEAKELAKIILNLKEEKEIVKILK